MGKKDSRSSLWHYLMGSEIMPELQPYSSVSIGKVSCWRSYVVLGPKYITLPDIVQCWGVYKPCHYVGHLLACPKFGSGSTGEILCFPLKGSKGDRAADSFQFRFVLIKNFSGVFQLTSTVNKSVKPLLTGCLSGKKLPIGKALIRNKERVEGLKGQGERFDEKRAQVMFRGLCHFKNWQTIKAAGKGFLDSSCLIWRQIDSNNISYNCLCQCLKPAGAPSLPIFCPYIIH